MYTQRMERHASSSTNGAESPEGSLLCLGNFHAFGPAQNNLKNFGQLLRSHRLKHAKGWESYNRYNSLGLLILGLLLLLFCSITLFGQAVGDTVVTLPQTLIKKNSMLNIVRVYYFQLLLPLVKEGSHDNTLNGGHKQTACWIDDIQSWHSNVNDLVYNDFGWHDLHN